MESTPAPADPAGIGRIELVEYPHPALLRRTSPLVRIDDALCDAIDQMFEIMYDAVGVGLAANQVGLPYRLFIVNLEANPDSGEELVFINPTLSRPRGTALQEEGCLSLPGLRMDVRRPEKVVIEAWTLEGEQVRLDLDGFLARVVQHEFDHLEGRLFTDRLPEAAALEARRFIDAQPAFETAHFLEGFGHSDRRFHFDPDWAPLGPAQFGPGLAPPSLPDYWPVIEEATPEHPFRLVTAPMRRAHSPLNRKETTTWPVWGSVSCRASTSISPETSARVRTR
jgi:peptide deformylase